MNSKADVMQALLDWMNEGDFDPTNPYHSSVYDQVDTETKEGIDWKRGLDAALKSLGRQTGNSGGAQPAYAPRASLPGISPPSVRTEAMPMQGGEFDKAAPILAAMLQWASRR